MKQGTLFTGWLHGEARRIITRTLPHGFTELNLAEHWNSGSLGQRPFASTVTPQFAVCEAGTQATAGTGTRTPDYGYHLDAAKFAGARSRRG